MLKKFRLRSSEKYYKQLFVFQDLMKNVFKFVESLCNFFFILTTTLFLALLIFHVGFLTKGFYSEEYFRIYRFIFIVIFLSKYIRDIIIIRKRRMIGWIYDSILFVSTTIVFVTLLLHHFYHDFTIVPISGFLLLIISTLLLIISEFYRLMKLIDSIKIPPALLFALSFFILIMVGSGLLMLPKAHVQPISYLESLFTSASAVCVTGLTVVDTATAFSLFGKIVILILIQVGGLGVMAFTGFFGFIFTGTVSFKDRILLKDIVSAETLGGIFRFITKIILFTFLIELAGAILIYLNIDESVGNRVFFAVFHAVSAFCNAGFSTLSAGLSSPEIAGNYVVSMTVAILIILGGIGFPVLILLYSILKNGTIKLFWRNQWKRLPANMLRKNIGSRIAITSTVILLISGTLFYYLFENKTSLDGLSGIDKFITSFFGSVSARTAGFNIVDISRWSYPTIFLMIFLMWIGASPGSTGGGIKTTTFAVALRAVYNFIRGRHTVEIGYRKLGSETISRVLVVIVLSICTIFAGFTGLMLADPLKNPVHLLFETVSAFATVGLSIVNTSTLSHLSKVIIICIMFIGRVGPLTLLSGFFITHKNRYYKVPEQDLIIN